FISRSSAASAEIAFSGFGGAFATSAKPRPDAATASAAAPANAITRRRESGLWLLEIRRSHRKHIIIPPSLLDETQSLRRSSWAHKDSNLPMQDKYTVRSTKDKVANWSPTNRRGAGSGFQEQAADCPPLLLIQILRNALYRKRTATSSERRPQRQLYQNRTGLFG